MTVVVCSDATSGDAAVECAVGRVVLSACLMSLSSESIAFTGNSLVLELLLLLLVVSCTCFRVGAFSSSIESKDNKLDDVRLSGSVAHEQMSVAARKRTFSVLRESDLIFGITKSESVEFKKLTVINFKTIRV